MPRSFVTSTHAAPSKWRYSSAWSSTLVRSEALSSRSRNCGTSADTALIPANVAVRPLRNACTPRRTPARARRMDWSAVRFAESDVSPSVTPRTPTTDSVAAMKILAPSPSRAVLVALASGVCRIVFAVLVLVGHPVETARVELELDARSAGRRDQDVLRHLRAALVPHVEHIATGRDVRDLEAPIGIRLGEVTARHHLHEHHHPRVHIAEDAGQPRSPERPRPRLASSVLSQVERIDVGRGENIVVEGVVVQKPDGRTDGDDYRSEER